MYVNLYRAMMLYYVSVKTTWKKEIDFILYTSSMSKLRGKSYLLMNSTQNCWYTQHCHFIWDSCIFFFCFVYLLWKFDITALVVNKRKVTLTSLSLSLSLIPLHNSLMSNIIRIHCDIWTIYFWKVNITNNKLCEHVWKSTRAIISTSFNLIGL
jgi:Zn-finger protein